MTESEWTRRFWSRVDVREPEECWPGRANLDRKGYAIVTLWTGRRMAMHAAAYRTTRNLPVGWIVHHDCRNRLCCNPRHLRAMTRSAHGLLHRQEQGPVGNDTCPKGHPYSVQGGRRQCQACANERRRLERGFVPRGPRGPYKKRAK